MFVYNLKINGSRTFKFIFSCMVIAVLIIISIIIYMIFTGSKNNINNSSCMPQNKVYTISATNYTNILKTVHENIDNYVGTKINFVGYVYRLIDFNDNQFVLARNMVVSADNQSVVVGFLCEYDNIKDFPDSTWVEVTGTIIKGDYHGDMPIVKITKIDRTTLPNDEYVYPPSNDYIPTNNML